VRFDSPGIGFQTDIYDYQLERKSAGYVRAIARSRKRSNKFIEILLKTIFG